MVGEIGESPVVLVVLGAALLSLVFLPGLIVFLRPSWIRAIVGLGVVVALALWIPAWFGDTGDMGRSGTVLLGGLWGLAVLVLWIGGVTGGRRIGRRPKTRRTDSRPA